MRGQWNNTWLWLGGYHKRSNGFHVAFSASFLVSLQGRLEGSTGPNLGKRSYLEDHYANLHETTLQNPHEKHYIMEVAGYSPILACTSFTSKSKLKPHYCWPYTLISTVLVTQIPCTSFKGFFSISYYHTDDIVNCGANPGPFNSSIIQWRFMFFFGMLLPPGGIYWSISQAQILETSCGSLGVRSNPQC